MLAFPFPYIATTAGWMTAELGRQPWIIFHILRTGQGVSDVVSGGNVLFTLIGFTGLYFVLGVLFLFLGRDAKSRTARKAFPPMEKWRCPMIEIWYAILTFMLVMFLVLEGFDIGAGMLQHIVGKTEAERRLVIAAIGPLWSWHEVWLVGFGGTLMVAFPNILASSFAGFYLAFFLLLWSLILRGISIEVGGHIARTNVAHGVEFYFCRGQFAARHSHRRGVGQRRARRPAECRRQIRPRFFHQLQPVWQRRHSRLVHRFRRRVYARDVCGARRKCFGFENRRAGA